MAIQFLDQRVSTFLIDSSGAELIAGTPLLIGDIGLQVVAAQDVNNVRVSLTGMAGIVANSELDAIITLTVEKNGTDTFGAGTVVFQEDFETSFVPSFSPLVVVAGDFPTAAEVLAGQIRYTLFASASAGAFLVSGPVTFNGSASSGTTD
ncbi:hypothetical protein [Paenibacillus herberti]|uniref:Uncharacterized protein n=1 Tax=Paenibacillus herberti TaxID=1619309 RepID=A0A229P2F6_9BACL|nr:hypothetical protein [Paenibacillus herberti]OXM16280.1 hypothetical protein CGZ75_06220 [Paenibacillus herberti]